MKKIRHIIVLLLSMSITYANANNHSFISIEQINEQKQATILDVFKLIETETGYVFFYSDEIKKELTTSVTPAIVKGSIEEILNPLFEKTALTYRVNGNQVVVKRKAIPMPPTSVAQQRGEGLSGVVVDSSGEPLIGVSVAVKGTTQGAVTDIDGKFAIENLPDKAKLIVSYVGYKTVYMDVKGQKAIKIQMEEDSQLVGEVVITGYGGTQKAKTLTASASTVQVKELAKLPVMTMSQGLGGRVTGVFTQEKSGAPGEITKIWIRGGDKVLYVIDDVVLETAQGEIFFNRLRPDDIASMTILKDASATAIYGPRANDGVVVIATKKGVEGRIDVTFNQKVSIMTPSYSPRVMDSYEYAEWRNNIYSANFQETKWKDDSEMSKLFMGYLGKQGKGYEEILSQVNNKYDLGYSLTDIQDLFDPYKTSKNIQDYYTTYDPWDFYQHVQPMYQTNLSVRGGGDRVRYYSSLGYMNQKGISSTFGYEQFNVMLNTDAYLLNDKSLKFTLNLNGNTSTKLKPATGDAVFNEMHNNPMADKPAAWSTGRDRNGSPLVGMRTGFDNSSDYRLQASMGLKYDLPWVKGLALTGNVNFNTSYNMNKKFEHTAENAYSSPTAASPIDYVPENARVTQRWSNYLLTTGIFQVDYNRQFGKHTVYGMVNYQSQVRSTNFTETAAKGYPTTFVPQIGAGTIFDKKDGGESKWGSASYIGRISYDYDGKYLLQYNANANGSLSYSPEKRWGFFQAVSAGWVLSEEVFFKENVNASVMDFLKIRASFGIVGGEIGGPFSFLNQYGQEKSNVVFGDKMNAVAAWKESQVASDLTWSKSRQISGGIDFVVLNQRLNGTVEAFLYMNNGIEMNMNQDEIRTDILGMPNVPQINAPFETSRKGGYEISLKWSDRIGEFGYNLGVNFSHWDERVTRHTDKSNNYFYSSRQDIGLRKMLKDYSSTYVTEGLYGSFDEMYYSLLHATRNLTPGSLIIKDVNGDGRIGGGDYLHQNPPGGTPLTQYGVNLGASYKGFELSLFFQGAAQVGAAMPNFFRGSYGGFLANYGKFIDSNNMAYSPDKNNTDALIPLPTTEANSWHNNSVDRWIVDASYLKLKNIDLRYDMKKYLLKRTELIKGLEVSFVVTNVFTLTKKSYPMTGLVDPEFMTGAGRYLGSYPVQRSYTLGFTVTL